MGLFQNKKLLFLSSSFCITLAILVISLLLINNANIHVTQQKQVVDYFDTCIPSVVTSAMPHQLCNYNRCLLCGPGYICSNNKGDGKCNPAGPSFTCDP